MWKRGGDGRGRANSVGALIYRQIQYEMGLPSLRRATPGCSTLRAQYDHFQLGNSCTGVVCVLCTVFAEDSGS